MDYQIVADSGCDLSPALQKELGVSLVPFQVTIDGHHFIDDRNLDLEQMISEMRAYKKAPSTACASPEEYAALFEQSDVTFCLTLSSRLSGSFNSALVGRDIALSRHPDKFIHIFDSMSASAGETLVARKIYEFASTLSTPHEVVQKMEAFIAGMKTFSSWNLWKI